MGFEGTPIPPPPGATFKGKIPEIRLTRGSMMDINNEYGVEDFAAEIAVISDHGSDSVDECESVDFVDQCILLQTLRRVRWWARRVRKRTAHCTEWRH